MVQSFSTKGIKGILKILAKVNLMCFPPQVLKDCLEKEDTEDVFGNASSDNELTSSNVKRVLLQIRSNLFGYARSVVSSAGENFINLLNIKSYFQN